jgi:hypothetical protein
LDPFLPMTEKLTVGAERVILPAPVDKESTYVSVPSQAVSKAKTPFCDLQFVKSGDMAIAHGFARGLPDQKETIAETFALYAATALKDQPIRIFGPNQEYQEKTYFFAMLYGVNVSNCDIPPERQNALRLEAQAFGAKHPERIRQTEPIQPVQPHEQFQPNRPIELITPGGSSNVPTATAGS